MFVTIEDVAPFLGAGQDPVKVQVVIDDTEAIARLEAPCIASIIAGTEDFAAIKAIVRSAVVRWVESGNGVWQAQSAGPFSIQTDTRQPRKAVFTDSELGQLQRICERVSGGGASRAYVIDTAPGARGHYPWCSSLYNAPGGPCDCGLL